jgi:hypothetical protein
MQFLHSSKPKVGDMVLIVWPRTRWDHRQGRLHELRHEQGQQSFGMVILDGIAVRFPLVRLSPLEETENY